MKKIFLLIIILALVIPVFASHIVGGEMIYEYVGPGTLPGYTKYKITLKLFRDQLSNGAAMPADVFIGIFSGTKQYPGAGLPYDFLKTREDDVPVNPYPPCIVNADPISYHVGIYDSTIELPNNAIGYTATYQTCCRVNPLANVSNSNSNGAGSTYTCFIPPYIDNSPKFSNNVSLICRSRNFSLDFSATDADGDSLAYSFCNAYDGGLAVGSSNINPRPPGYTSVIYNTGFSATSPLGSLVTINSGTGIISGIAPATGKYVICVCVQSYKNGVLAGDHRKDFIVKIGDCDFAGAQLQPRPVTCDGFKVTFANNNNSPLNQTFFWDFGVTSLTDDTSNLKSPTFNYPDTGVYVYKLVINRNQPCGDSAFQTIKVYPGFFPGFEWTTECANSPIKFLDTTKSKYGIINFWKWDFGNPFTLADTSNMQNPVYSFPNSGNPVVTFIVGDDKGCIDTMKVPITVVDNPVITNLFKDTVYCGKDTLQLHAVTGTAGSITWFPNTNILNANSANPLVFPPVTTQYFVKLTAAGCVGTDTITVNPKYDLTDSIAASSLAICEEDSLALTAITNHLPVKYLWSPAASLSSDTFRIIKASPPATILYTLTAAWGKHCVANASTKIDVKKLARPNAGADTSFCIGSAGVKLTASGGDNYIWTPASGLSDPTVPNPLATPNSTTNYVVSAGVIGCTARREDSVLVTLRNLPAIAITNDTLICSLDTLQLSAAATAAKKYYWTPDYSINNQNIGSPLIDPKVPTRYYVQVTDGFSCINNDSVFIDVKQFVTMQSRTDTTICQNDIIQLKTSGDALHYDWSPSSTLDDATAVSPFATPLATTTYRVTGNIGNCTASNDIKITVVPYPKAFAGNDTSICYNTSATLHATGGNSYSWSPAAYLSDAGIPNPVSNPDKDVQYVVTVTDNKGCPKAASDTILVKLYPKFVADAGPHDTSVVMNEPVQLHGSGGVDYLWSPDAGLNNPHIANPEATLNNNQQYILKVSNAIGCFETDTINITVYKLDAGLYVPNAFTPNGDNLNDIFRPVQLGMKYLNYFKVYNRFGQLVFSTSQLNQGWDGKLNGKPQNPDVYIWIVDGVDFSNKKIFKKGTVVLIR